VVERCEVARFGVWWRVVGRRRGEEGERGRVKVSNRERRGEEGRN
jgi:hypothetical protein